MGETHERTHTPGSDANSVAQIAVQRRAAKASRSTRLGAIAFGLNASARKAIHDQLVDRGHEVVSTDDLATARTLFDRHRSDMVFLCGLDGDALEFAKSVRRLEGERTVLVGVVSGEEAARTALKANLDETIFDRFDQQELDVKLALTERRAKRRIRWRSLEADLRESESRYRLLAEHSTDMISRHDAEGRYTYASPACTRLLGYEPDDLVGRSAYEFFHPDDVPAVRRSHDTVLDTESTSTVLYRIRKADGDYVWVETTASQRRLHGGRAGRALPPRAPRHAAPRAYRFVVLGHRRRPGVDVGRSVPDTGSRPVAR